MNSVPKPSEIEAGKVVYHRDFGRGEIIKRRESHPDKIVVRDDSGTTWDVHRLHLRMQPITEPVDMWAEFNPPELPKGLLPDIIERFAFERGNSMGSDPAGLAMSALAVCAAAIPDTIKVQVKEHDTYWLEAPRLWVALVGLPSTKKSPAIEAAARPLKRIDAAMAREYQKLMADWSTLSKDEQKGTSKPKHVRKRIEDTTIEAAQGILADSPDGVLLLKDEMSGWFGAMDKYSGSKGAAADRAFWLQSFNGASYSFDRVGRGSNFIDPLSVSMLGGIQPEPMRALAKDAHDDGLIQRLCPVILRPAQMSLDVPNGSEVTDYEDLIERLTEQRPPAAGGGIMSGLPGVLRFDEDAQAIRRDQEKRYLELLAIETINPKMAAHIGKMDGIFARLCVVWHTVENAYGKYLPSFVTADTAGRVAAFINGFMLPHAFSFYLGTLGLSDHAEAMKATAAYLLAHPDLTVITPRDIQRGDRAMRSLDRDSAVRVLERLEACSWLDPAPIDRNQKAPRWTVNQRIHRLFAERAKSEEVRRNTARKAITETFGQVVT